MIKKQAPRQSKNQMAFDFDALSPDAKSYVTATASVRHRRMKKTVWRGMPAVPPGSLLETVLDEFQKKTNISLEIPFTTFLHYVAGVLIGKDTTIRFQEKSMNLDVWTIVLAQSGAGKTWTEKEIKSGLSDMNIPMLNSSAASAARFLEELEAKPHSLWIRDEYYQLLKQIDTIGSPLAEMKDYLLRAYDNADIERSTKKDIITVQNPIISILGFTALAPFVEGMNLENLVDGFAQRFAYVLARPDKSRHFKDYPVWTVDKSTWSERFKEMFANNHSEYIVSEKAEKSFARMFKSFCGKVELEESFYRRVLWRGHKYALLYHVIRGAGDNKEIVEEDYGWAARLIEMQLHDAADVIDMCTGTDITKAIDAAEATIARLISEGKPVTARSIVMGTRLVKSVQVARLVFQILGIEES